MENVSYHPILSLEIRGLEAVLQVNDGERGDMYIII
jgi:hypothetical protein